MKPPIKDTLYKGQPLYKGQSSWSLILSFCIIHATIHLHLRKDDKLSKKDKNFGPEVSFIRSFHCINSNAREIESVVITHIADEAVGVPLVLHGLHPQFISSDLLATPKACSTVDSTKTVGTEQHVVLHVEP